MSVRVLMGLKAALKSPDGILAEGVGSSGCVTAVGSASVMHLLTAQASRLLVELHETVGPRCRARTTLGVFHDCWCVSGSDQLIREAAADSYGWAAG